MHSATGPSAAIDHRVRFIERLVLKSMDYTSNLDEAVLPGRLAIIRDQGVFARDGTSVAVILPSSSAQRSDRVPGPVQMSARRLG